MFERCLARISLFLALLPLGFACHSAAIAGTLKIETKTRVSVTGEMLKAKVMATNKGDAPAHNVQVHLVLLGEQDSGPVRAQLKAGESDTVVFEKTLSESKKGRYPLVVLVDFHDANQYPFSAVSCTTFAFIEDKNPDLICLGDDIAMGKKGLVKFTVKNLGSGWRIIRANLILPKELSSPTPQMDFQIDPKAERKISFAIDNFSALPGGNYPVFCSFEYDIEDTHRTAVAKAVVKIVQSENWFRRTRTFWIGAVITLGVILVVLQLKGKRH